MVKPETNIHGRRCRFSAEFLSFLQGALTSLIDTYLSTPSKDRNALSDVRDLTSQGKRCQDGALYVVDS